ncbi:hypothetical protein MNBD_NITROSPINAE01-1814 [hydrothermal vent metagenome]|uniref:Cytochrome c domain-containing protein n=1 Tax=hydrothermal vent metagenome TaxID=652676 RepID=A0A3B1C8P9_9ZZZZ
MRDRKIFGVSVTTLVIVSMMAFSSLLVGDEAFAGNPCNPCAKKKMNACNPCAKNPCAKKSKNACNPCNPCAKGKKRLRTEKAKDFKKLVALGKKLWNDEGLGKSGLACMTCHEGAESLNMDKHMGMWPHEVKMADDIMTLDQMINFCMVNPMETKPLDPNGVKMTAMAAYYHHLTMSHMGKKGGMSHHNPCNPCAKNPCAKNPCGKGGY